jgi:primosomal protein N' (replication factor Y)
MNYYLIAVNTPFNNSLLTYSFESEELKKGMLVKIPLGKRVVDGCVWARVDSKNIEKADKIKAILEIDIEVTLDQSECELFEWMSHYYHYPVGQLINDTLPHFLKKPRKLNFIQGKGELFHFNLNEEQKSVVDNIEKVGLDHFSKWLVHGVTGAGKTIVYLYLMKKIIEKGKSVIFLLPEINLTPQFMKVFENYLDVPIYSYNSSITNSDKFGLWKLLQNENRPVLLLGVRSSVFLPIKNLGLIIVDEEHDQSFKQDDRCTYNARDVAIKKASLLNVPIVLGSATPMIETYSSFKKANSYFTLKKRAQTSKLPVVTLVDMRGKLKDDYEKLIWPYSVTTIDKISEALNRKEQVIIFINRLGYSSYLQCGACGHQFTCPNCSTNLKFYKKRNELQCQTCEYKEPKPEMCPECMNLNLTPKGFGTEKAHEVLQQVFKNKTVERFDRDEIKNFTQLENVLDDFHSKKIDILVGTQMLSKGHNFQDVNLVVILGIDAQLNFPDFRSNERVYQTLTQVSGRAGRFGKDAEVLIHTLAPENKIFTYVKDHSFDNFYNDELELRKICSSPPFKKIILIYLSSKSQLEVIENAESLANMMRQLNQKHFSSVEVLGPRPSMIEKKVNKFTWSIMLRGHELNELHNSLNSLLKNFSYKSSISLKVDIDPYYFD